MDNEKYSEDIYYLRLFHRELKNYNIKVEKLVFVSYEREDFDDEELASYSFICDPGVFNEYYDIIQKFEDNFLSIHEKNMRYPVICNIEYFPISAKIETIDLNLLDKVNYCSSEHTDASKTNNKYFDKNKQVVKLVVSFAEDEDIKASQCSFLYQEFPSNKNESNTSVQIDIKNDLNFLQYNDKIKEELVYDGKSRQNFWYS